MWQRFTERARKVVFYAQEEAQQRGDNAVSTEHILLGIVREDCRASTVLEALGCTRESVKAAVEARMSGVDPRVSTNMTLTSRAKRVVDLAYDEARSHNHNYIGTEHLLAGLLRQGDGLAGQVLKSLGVTLEGIWAAWAGEELPPERITPASQPEKAHRSLSDDQNVPERWLLLTRLYKFAAESQHLVMGEAMIVFALLDESEGALALAHCLGLDSEGVRAALRQEMTRSYDEGELRPSPSFSEFLAAAEAARVSLGHSRVQPGHLVLAVLSCDCYGKEVLHSCGLTQEHAWEAIRGLYSHA